MSCSISLVVKFESDTDPGSIDIGDSLFGGSITSTANYDVMEAMNIAEQALSCSSDQQCAKAIEAIDSIMYQGRRRS